MNHSVINNSIINNSTNEKDDINSDDSNFFHSLFILMQNNQHMLLIVLNILTGIFIFELLLMLYLHIKKKTLK